MPRLLAIEGPEVGLALPLHPTPTYLVPGQGGRIRLLRQAEEPALGLAIERAPESGGWRLRRLGAARGAAASPVFVNGVEVEQSPLAHGDLVTFAGATLMFDGDDPGADTTRSDEAAAAAAALGPAAGSPSAAAEQPPQELLGGESVRYRQPVYDDPRSALRGAERSPDRATRRLATLLQVASALGASLELERLLEVLLDRLFEVLPASRGTILVFDRPARQLRSLVGKERGRPAAAGIHVPVSRTIVREAVRTRQAILSVDALQDERFRSGASVAAAGIRSALCVPVVRAGRVRAVIHLDTAERARAFGPDDLELASAIAAFAGLAIENAVLYAGAAERERLRHELRLATAIQHRLLPREQLVVPGLEIAGRMVPAKELGGDCFDMVAGADGSAHVVLGDVAGKGIGAALVMVMARSYFRPLMRADLAPRDVVAEVNRWLFRDTEPHIFMSAIYARWDPGRGLLRWCGAGQEHLLVVRAGPAAPRCEALRAGGMALALTEDATPYLEERALPLAPGDTVVLYTDGAIDARDPAGRPFGLERLRALLEQHAAAGRATEVLDAVLAAVRAHTGEAEPHDDVTVVVLKRT